MSLRLAAEAPLPRIFFALVLSGGDHYLVFYDTVVFKNILDLDDFWCLFRPGGCLWSLTGCPLTPEAARTSFLDTFWSDLELILGGLGDHFWSLFGVCFAVCFWSGFGAGFCPILAPFWVTFWSCFGAFLGAGLKSATEALA